MNSDLEYIWRQPETRGSGQGGGHTVSEGNKDAVGRGPPFSPARRLGCLREWLCLCTSLENGHIFSLLARQRNDLNIVFLVSLRWKCLDRGLSRCLADEMLRRFGLGGFVFVKSVCHVVLLRFFIICFFVVFGDAHTLHIVGGQNYYMAMNIAKPKSPKALYVGVRTRVYQAWYIIAMRIACCYLSLIHI